MAIQYKKCPNCHSKNGATILYGMPTSEAAELAKKKKLYLGGCVMDVQQPQYHCYQCEFEWTKADAIKAAYEQIDVIEFEVGGYFDGTHVYRIDFLNGEIEYKHSRQDEAPQTKKLKQIEIEKQRLMNTGLLDWKKSYVNREILDGEQWSIKIFSNGKQQEKYGSNQYPRNWGVFCYWVDELLKKRLLKEKYNQEKAKFELTMPNIVI